MEKSANNIKLIILINLMLIVCTSGQRSRIGFQINNLFRNTANEKYIIKATTKNSYPLEEHTVTTSDGYILKVHRVPPSSKSSCKRKVPILIAHGMTGNAEVFFINGPGRSLAYVLSDAGYDAWYPNARGTTYSRKHRTLDPNDFKFWEFSYHEIGIYDLPAVIDYILDKTAQPKLHFVGHSQGNTVFFVMASMLPEYNAKIKTMHAFAPVAYVEHATNPVLKIVSSSIKELENLARNYGFMEIFPNSWLVGRIGPLVCSRQDPRFCFDTFNSGGRHDPKMEDNAIFPEILSFYPAGLSMFQLLHYAQGKLNGGFQLYDFGERRNIKKYGQKRPPDYPLQNVNTSSMFFYVSVNDQISRLPDVDRLMKILPKKPIYIKMEDKLFAHYDYAVGRYAKQLVYDKMIEAMKKCDEDTC